MPDSTDFPSNQMAELAGKIALELAYAQPGKDYGLLPVNCLLSEIQELASDAPKAIQEAVASAVRIVESIFESTGVFDESSIAQLTSWAGWMDQAVRQESNDIPLESFISEPAVAEPQAEEASPALAVEPAQAIPEEEVLQLDIENDGELLVEFCNEGLEHLQNIEQGVLVLETEPSNADTLATIFRAFHTFKGGAGLLNLMPVKNLAHELETVLDLARNAKLTVDTLIIDLILAGGDTFKHYINEIQARLNGGRDNDPIAIPTGDLLARVQAIVRGEKPAASATVVKVASNPEPAAAKEAEPSVQLDAKSSSPTTGPAGNAASSAPAKTISSSTVKVDTQKLDSLMDLVGEMVIAQSLVGQDEAIASIESQKLSRNLAQLARITKDLQRTAMALRMVPIRSTFQKMTRLVRDTAARQNKDVVLVMNGEDTELDRTIVEEIGDPLIHMIRNSVDHGIESPEDRRKAGKPEQGVVHLSAFHQGGNIMIQIRDDGRGLNRDKIRSKAIERGLISDKDQLSDSEVFNLIFAPGFSTADQVTDISGRGVGMDVVRRNIEKLRGKVDIESEFGMGSTFTIALPLTLAIIDGLIVGIGGHRFIIPTLTVRESFRPTRDMIKSINERGEMVNVRGRLSPLLRLYDFFGIESATQDPAEAILVVIDNNGETRCLMVDSLLGKQEVVIKSLGESFKKAPAIAGGAILGDGRVGLIIDASSLVSLRTRQLKSAA